MKKETIWIRYKTRKVINLIKIKSLRLLYTQQNSKQKFTISEYKEKA